MTKRKTDVNFMLIKWIFHNVKMAFFVQFYEAVVSLTVHYHVDPQPMPGSAH